MPVVRSAEELRAAVDSMFRIRAVESPPDASGLRKVWHRGARDAELVSEIDEAGRVARHEFSLFDDVVVWERGRGFVTGESHTDGGRAADKVSFDLTTDPGRLERIAAALKPYVGRDRIIQHLRELVVTTQEGKQPLQDLGAVTGSNMPAIPAQYFDPPAPPPRSKGLVWAAIGLVVIAIALVVLALK
jgi:hypothetical protein